MHRSESSSLIPGARSPREPQVGPMSGYIRGNAVQEMHRNKCRMMSEALAHKCPICHPTSSVHPPGTLQIILLFFLHKAIFGLPNASMLCNCHLVPLI
jgi:hypothetical protein